MDISDTVLVKDRKTGKEIYVPKEHYEQVLSHQGRYLEVPNKTEPEVETETKQDDVPRGRKRRSTKAKGGDGNVS